MNDLPPPTRVFLSYARGDDEAFVKRLHANLSEAGFTVWFDRVSLPSRQLTFHQEIKDAILKETDRLIYVGGPKAALSAYVREEWQFALECDHVVVTPILRLGDYEHVPGELSLLHCEDFRDDPKYEAALAKLIASLRQPNPKLGALFAVPSLPPHFLGRPGLMRRVRDALLVDLQKPQVITSADARVGMQGMGGIGKSVLAAALARQRQVRQAYPDGVVWISCGQKLSDDDLLKRQKDLVGHLKGDTGFDSLPQGHGVLRQLLAAKAVLLVLDDVWRAADAEAFNALGPRCRMLVTTRDKGILDTLHGELVSVSLFTEPEALQLLADAVGVTPATLPPEAREVVRECGCLPLALALCGGMARKRGTDFHSVLERLRRADLEKIADRESINEQHRSIWRAMQASVEMLPNDEQQRFAELSVFATDQTVPEATAATLWAHTSSLDDLDTEELLINLAERSLIQLEQKPGTDGKVSRRFRLHDLLYDYAVRIAGDRPALHQSLLNAYRQKCPGGWHTGPNDSYFFENLVHHHVERAAWLETEALVTDFAWLMRKCELGLLESISNDYILLGELAPPEVGKRLEMWDGFFREKAHILRRGNEEWPTHKILLQLAVEHADDSPLTIGAERWLAEDHCDWLWLRRVSRLPHARRSPWLAVLEGHTDTIHGALELSDGRLLSWSVDNTLRLWDGQTGACLAVLTGHRAGSRAESRTWDYYGIHGALELSDGRLLSWSDDDTLRLWDGKNGVCLAVLAGHKTGAMWEDDGIHGALELSDGRLLSWSWDQTLRLWDSQRGLCLAVLKGHTNEVHGALELSDGRLLSWSFDNTLRLWDGQSGACLTVLEGHTDGVDGAVALSNGRLLSWSRDMTLRLWDGQSGTCLAVLKGHTTYIRGAQAFSNERLLSWSDDKTLRLWDGQSEVCLAVLEGHTEPVRGALALADGRLLSWSDDKTLRLWDGQSGVCLAVLEGHTEPVCGARELADGRLVSWSHARALRLWNGQSGACLAVLEGHTESVCGVLALADGRLLSWASDKTMRFWDGQSGVCPAVLEGHSATIGGALALADGRGLSWSRDKTLRLWDGQSGCCLAVLEGHADTVWGALALTDGRLLSWSEDHSLRLWDSQSSSCLAVLEGHTGLVLGALELSDGRLLSRSTDNTLRLWDGQTGTCLTVLTGHSHKVWGSLALSDGRLLSWSDDKTLRLWDGQSGACRAVLKGHTAVVDGAMALSDGQLLSWSWDGTLRLWNGQSGTCLMVLKGHTHKVWCALALSDGSLLSWSTDKTLRLWDRQSGRCLEVVPEHQVAHQHPDWLHARAEAQNPANVSSNFYILSPVHAAHLHHKTTGSILAAWNADADAYALSLLPDGTAIVSQANHQVCILKLHHGQRRVTLAEAVNLNPFLVALSDEAREALLRDGLAQCQAPQTLGRVQSTLAHLAALAVHMKRIGKSAEAAEFQRKHVALANRCDLLVRDKKRGDALRAQGDLAGALQAFRESLTVLQAQLSASDAADAGLQDDILPGQRCIIEGLRREISMSQIIIGDELRAQGNLDGALQAYRESLAVRERLVVSNPCNARWQYDLFGNYEKLAQVTEQMSTSPVTEWWQKTYSQLTLGWWRKACDQLSDMQQRGIVLPTDEQHFAVLRQKAGR